MKKLNIAMVGYGFMGRTHSNAYRRVNNFFDLEYEPVLKVICGLEEKEAKAFAEQWGCIGRTLHELARAKHGMGVLLLVPAVSASRRSDTSGAKVRCRPRLFLSP